MTSTIRSTSILGETYERLRSDPGLAGRRILGLALNLYFTVIELDDGSVGACASYYEVEPKALGYIQKGVERAMTGDPLLDDLLFSRKGRLAEELFPRDQRTAFVEALRGTVVSALSARVLRDGDGTFSSSPNMPYDLLTRAKTGLVIGFGGYMQDLSQCPNLEALYVSDFSYYKRRGEMDAFVRSCRQIRPGLEVRIDNGRDTEARLREADLVCITGSALCNGSMEGLLDGARDDATVIVSGQSAAIHPRAFFERGVDLVTTTLKPAELLGRARSGPNGDQLRPFLEDGLSLRHLTPGGPNGRAPAEGPATSAEGRLFPWFEKFSHLFAENGYGSPPISIYRSFLAAIDRGGKILELGCGNGLLLRFLREHSGYHLEPYGVDCNEHLIARAGSEILPDRAGMIACSDARSFDFAGGPFDLILANPIHADRGYSEQTNNRITRYYGDGSVARYIRRCRENLAPGGRLVLWCFGGQLSEIAPNYAAFERDLACVSPKELRPAVGNLRFWVADL